MNNQNDRYTYITAEEAARYRKASTSTLAKLRPVTSLRSRAS
jgi:hypothetical protein